MSIIDNILDKYNVKYKDLNSLEVEELNKMLNSLSQNQLTVEKIKDYIRSMKNAVERDLSVSKIGKKQDILLKARLRNYMLLEDFLSTPERAKEALDRSIASIIPKKK